MNFTEGCELTGRRPGSAGSRRRRAPRPGPVALLPLLLPLLLPPAAAVPLPAAADSSGEVGLEEEAGARRALPDCESAATSVVSVNVADLIAAPVGIRAAVNRLLNRTSPCR